MGLLTPLMEIVDAGDPVFRTWPLLNTCWQPFVFSLIYVFIVKRLGPVFMKNRKPFDLRKLMIVYNFCVVCVYGASLCTISFIFLTTDAYKYTCRDFVVTRNNYTYYVAYAIWCIYLLKYVEYTDTIFFILRKKDHLITNLHVIHHFMLPIIGWFMLRSERTGFQLLPVFLNSTLHVIMYTYYGLAAMGPEVQKYLWWKVYLTRLQMVQFVLILLLMFVVYPLSGCKSTKPGVLLQALVAGLFLGLFYNFYIRRYKVDANRSASNCANGEQKSRKAYLKRE